MFSDVLQISRVHFFFFGFFAHAIPSYCSMGVFLSLTLFFEVHSPVLFRCVGSFQRSAGIFSGRSEPLCFGKSGAMKRLNGHFSRFVPVFFLLGVFVSGGHGCTERS